MASSTWFKERQKASSRRFEELGYPTRSLEAWKTIDLTAVLNTPFAKGRFTYQADMPKGAKLAELSAAIGSEADLAPYWAAGFEKENNAFAALNTANFETGLYVNIPDETCLIQPIHLFLNSTGPDPYVVYPRLLLTAGKRARASVVIHCAGTKEMPRHFVNAVSEFYLGAGTHLEVVWLAGDQTATQFAANRFFLDEGSALECAIFTQGGVLTRHEVNVHFRAPRASASIRGLSLLKNDSQAFFHTAAHHAVPECTSRQFYKSILTDKAKSEFNSMVHVHPGASKSDSKQLGRHLLLSGAAQGFTRPQLEIENDDVSCAHGATVGQINEEEVFYLRSRGLSKETAQFLMTYGFAEELIEEIHDKALKKELEAWIEKEIRGMVR
ncbi:MAG: Fe-S cluster assembly protein SufD [Candidatus Omnitrophica bacterium]|nr:Fe-S cluster assembly protein SufD [Candidatus Omnitrophota bacterium]